MSHVTTFPDAMQPTGREVLHRTMLFPQLGKFVVLNLKMIKMVRMGHH